MSRTTRLGATAALGLALTGAGLVGAPAALAEEPLPTPTLGSPQVATGVQVGISGTDCFQYGKDDVGTVTAAVWTDLADVGGIMAVGPDGRWGITLTFPAGTEGTHAIHAVCDDYWSRKPYPDTSIVVTGATRTAPAPTPIRGASANSPGVTSPDSGTATGDRAAPGGTVVKILRGFKAFEWVTVTLHSTPQVVGTFQADASGAVRVEFPVPAGTPVADHTLVYLGDQGTYYQEAFTVAAAGSSGSAGGLAYTGADVTVPLVGGIAALAAGGAVTFLARKRRTTEAGA